jgi:hypothetical protein
MILICANCCINLEMVPLYQNNHLGDVIFECNCCGGKFSSSVMILCSFWNGNNLSKIVCKLRGIKLDKLGL